MNSLISVINKADTDTLVIDIEGVIGIPEYWQFENPEDRVATYDKFKSAVDKIRNSNTSNVEVNIRSIGGNVNDALLIHDAIIVLNANVTTRCFGYVASAATIIAQAASEGRREVSDNSLYLIHKAITSVEGNIDDINSAINILEKTDETIASIYAKRSGMPVETFVALMSENDGNGRWLSSDEVVKAGLADVIINSPTVANISQDDIRDMRLPAIPQNTITPKKENMKVKILNTLSFVLSALGLSPAENAAHVEVDNVDLERVNNRLGELETSVTTLTGERDSLSAQVSDITSQRDDLQTRFDNLQTSYNAVVSERDKLKAGPTTTDPKEDPALGEGKTPANLAAYTEDAKAFK